MVKKSEDIILKLKEILGDRNDDDVLSVYEDIQDSISTTDNTSTYEERIRQISEDWETKYNDLDDYWRTKYTSRFFTTPDEVVECAIMIKAGSSAGLRPRNGCRLY